MVSNQTITVASGRGNNLGQILTQVQLTLGDLADILRSAQAIPADFAFEELTAANVNRRAELKRTDWYTCGSFKGTRRRKEELTSCTAVALDVDQAPATRETLLTALDALGCAYVAATSTSHGVDGQARYRVVIPLAVPVSTERCKEIWGSLRARLPGVDSKAPDSARANYFPLAPIGAAGHEVICVDDRPWLNASSIQTPVPLTAAEVPRAASAAREELTPEQIADARAALAHLAVCEVATPGAVNWTADVGYALLKHGARDLWLDFCEAARGASPDHGGEVWWERHRGSPVTSDIRHLFAVAGKLGWQNPRIAKTASPDIFPLVASPTSGAHPTLEALEADENKPERQKSKTVRMFGLMCNDRGKPLSNAANAERFVRGILHGALSFDEFRDQVMILWAGAGEKRRPWRDEDATRLQVEMQRRGMVTVGRQSVIDAVDMIARDHRTNVITEWLLGLKWDRKRRLSTWLQRTFGVPSDRYHIRVGRNMLISMVARAMEPGCKVDESIVFEGEQGTRKTQALEIIGGEFFKELAARAGTKDFIQQLRGVWLGEFSELAAFKRPEDIEDIKQFLTCRVDHYRPSYGRTEVDLPRRIVFCGSTNADHWSHDPTGARRFNPVKVHKVDLPWLREHREQLFAESVQLYQSKRTWWTYPKKETREHRAARLVEDSWDYQIAEFLKGRREALVREILEWALRIEVRDQTRSQSTRVGQSLKKLGCVPVQRRMNGSTPRTVWIIPEEYSKQLLTLNGPQQFENIKEPFLPPADDCLDLIGDIEGVTA